MGAEASVVEPRSRRHSRAGAQPKTTVAARTSRVTLVVSRSALFDEGGSNTIRRLAPTDEELCRRRGIPMRQWPQNVSALLRTSKPRATPHAVRDAWVQWELSRLAVAPPTFAVWLECTASCCEAVRLHSIVQEWGASLKHPSARGADAIAGSPHARERALDEAVVEQRSSHKA